MKNLIVAERWVYLTRVQEVPSPIPAPENEKIL